MADVFPADETESCIDGKNNESIMLNGPTEICVVVEEPEEEEESRELRNNIYGDIRENGSVPMIETCSMTLKESSEEDDIFSEEMENFDLLPPVTKLEKYSTSRIAANRQIVARSILDTLRLVHGNANDVSRVFNVLCNISEDWDPMVRMELMAQLPHIAAFCKEDVHLVNAIYQHFVPMLIASIGEEKNQVRKSSHLALLSMVDRDLIDHDTVVKKIFPMVLHLTDSLHAEDLRVESIVLLSKMVTHHGRQTAYELFLQPFLSLCEDSSNNVRKACASVYGDICFLLGQRSTEHLLLPRFFSLCEDEAWCVRKECVENFMPVSSVVSRETRCKELAKVYMSLLGDQSRWVRAAAFQALGPFISTFAEPEKTGLYYSKTLGVLTVSEIFAIVTKNIHSSDSDSNEDVAEELSPCDTEFPDSNSNTVFPDSLCQEYRTVIEVSSSTNCSNAIGPPDSQDGVHCDQSSTAEPTRTTSTENGLESGSGETVTLVEGLVDRTVVVPGVQDGGENGAQENGDILPQSVEVVTVLNACSNDSSAFNHFQYWREPLEDFNAEKALEEVNREVQVELKGDYQMDYKSNRISRLKSYDLSLNHLTVKKTEIYARNMTDREQRSIQSHKQRTTDAFEQDIVPPELLIQYLNMIDADWAQNIDAEIARHCAYSLPAVAFTLGRKYWPCLKETFHLLSSDVQGFIMMWKVRRTVASTLHQLAVILGPEITTVDLVPVFERFITDLNEVRIGVLEHLWDFLKVLKREKQLEFLPALKQFLVNTNDLENNEKNWRFRLILADQLVSIVDLYEPEQVKEHLVPLCFTLIRDKVSKVRLAAVRVMASVMRRLSQCLNYSHAKTVLTELTKKFMHSPKWMYRQLYVYICQEFVDSSALTPDQFAEDAMPQMLYLCWDRVPNVRIAIARCLVTVIWPIDAFSNRDSVHRDLLLQTIHTLQSDVDADVRYYANMVATNECSCLQNGTFSMENQPCEFESNSILLNKNHLI